MVQLHDIASRSNGLLYFDGFISDGHTKRYVQKVPFEVLSIGGYEDTSLHTVGENLWIQSRTGKRLNVWYCLRNPASEYRRFYEPFSWMAGFAKHLVDYLYCHKQISLIHLKHNFHQWLRQTHGTDESFRRWLDMRNGNTDFRTIAAANAPFLLDQASQLDPAFLAHPLWDEIDPGRLNGIPEQVGHSQEELRNVDGPKAAPLQHKTVVTPYVYETFRHLPFAKCFEVVPERPSEVKTPDSLRQNSARNRRKCNSHVTDPHSTNVTIGNVVAVRSDTTSNWKTDDKVWYGYVSGIKKTKIGEKLNLLWLYRPSDTPCQGMRYPHSKELFLSDHCNCGDGPIYVHEVILKPRVAFFGNPEMINADADIDFFVRQKYVESESAWETLKKSDFHCNCGVETLARDYKIGDTLLIARSISSSQQVLEPVVLVEKAPNGFTKLIKVRSLSRLGRDVDGEVYIEPNELVYTDLLDDVPVADVHRSCHIRFYTKEEKDRGNIPAPYSRKGTADCFFITSHISSNDKLPKPLIQPWPPMNQGWDPSAATCRPKLKGLDIFCGGGNLGRGLEEGGAVEFKWAVDYFKEAIHTYKANAKQPSTQYFYGSVNAFLRKAMNGRGGKVVAQAGEVEVISAGSPCQGFSLANHRRGNDRSLLNISMVASVVSYIDFYRPKYAFLENVLGMAKCGVDGKRENVFAQVICALVGLGYQLRSSTLDAWSFGSPQSRTRLFISIAAPGLTPLSDPPQSHSHPAGIVGRSLGKTANGLPLGSRYWDLTPFEYVTIGQATKDLPSTDGKTSCIPFPDHRITRSLSILNQIKISCVPRYPRGMSFIKAVNRGLMPPPQMETLESASKIRTSEISRSWQRVNPDALIPTVTTCCQPEDGISGSWVHWDENRAISVMEVRRAQGFPDDEVIVGSPAMQWKIIGNSVARPVALALGMSLRAAWLANGPQSVEAPAVEGVVPQVAARLEAIVNVSKNTDSDDLHSSYRSSENRRDSPSNNRLAKTPSLPLRTTDKRLVSLNTPSLSSESPPKKRKTQASPSTPLLSSQEIITISSDSDSDSETLKGSTTHTSLSSTREATSSDTGATKMALANKKKKWHPPYRERR